MIIVSYIKNHGVNSNREYQDDVKNLVHKLLPIGMM